MSAIGMPGHLLALFAPRAPLDFVPSPKKRKRVPYTGLGDLLDLFESDAPMKPPPFETPKQRKKRLKEEKAASHAEELARRVAEYDPLHDSESIKTQNPNKTLFVGRLSYETNEKKLLNMFEVYGPVRDIRVVTDKQNKPRGYAFVEFERNEDMRVAFREADGKRVEGRRIVLDIERGRTDSNWLPRRLGGGRGPQRDGRRKIEPAAASMSSYGYRTGGPGSSLGDRGGASSTSNRMSGSNQWTGGSNRHSSSDSRRGPPPNHRR